MHRDAGRLRARLLVAGLAVAALIVFGAGCSEDDVEEVLGEASSASIESAYGTDRDPMINEWLSTVGHTVVAHSRRQSIPYEFRVIETDLVNAFAAPYGHVYVTRGFLDFVEAEDEAWMVVAHEVGHIVNRDSIKSFKQSLLMGIFTQVLRGESQTLGDVAGIGLGLLSLQYSRDDEYAADDAGTLLCYRAGYDPHQGLEFFDRLMTEIEKRRPSRWEIYFRTHPATEDRIRRQKAREELDRTDPDSVVRIARGYLLRGQPAMASRLLEQGVEAEPRSPELQSLLGDAYAQRGLLDRAEEAYRAALEQQPGLEHAQTRLAALDDAPEPAPAGIGASGREEAGRLLAELGQTAPEVEQARTKADTWTANQGEQLETLGSTVKSINGRLLDLAEFEGEVEEATQDLVVRGNAAVSRATESVYALEAVNEDLGEVGSELNALVSECEMAVKRAQQGAGNPGDVAALRTAILELRRGGATLELAMAETPETMDGVRAAQSSAQDLASLMEMMVRRDDPDSPLAHQLRAAATHTQQLGIDALHAVSRARRQSIKARGHALLARLNLLGTRATPYQQRLFDRQVAHLLMVSQAQVRALRDAGAGYGEVAMAIAAGKSARTDAERFIPALAGGISPVGEAMQREAAVGNAGVLMKFLAHRMQTEREVDAAM